jgi:hypothetical protein
MYLRLTPNLLHFLPNLDGLHALRPTFMKSTPGWKMQSANVVGALVGAVPWLEAVHKFKEK